MAISPNDNKKKTRLSLQFNGNDKDQADAIKILKEMGHRKSLFISKAVLYYINNVPDALAPFNSAKNLNRVIVEAWFKDMIKDYIKDPSLLNDIPLSNNEISSVSETTETVTVSDKKE